MNDVIPWVLSGWTLVTMWLAGNSTRWAWVSGLASQFLWFTFAWRIEAWGLLPLSVALTVVYARNWHKWRRAAQEGVSALTRYREALEAQGSVGRHGWHAILCRGYTGKDCTAECITARRALAGTGETP